MAKYLYNGIELPALPEWNRVAYPYAALIMCTYTEGQNLEIGDLSLHVSNAPWMAVGDNTSLTDGVTDTKPNYTYYYSKREWEMYEGGYVHINLRDDPVVGFGSAWKLIWSNHDIYSYEYDSEIKEYVPLGTLYLAASDPVPVLTQTARDLYRKINGKPTKLTLYKKVGGKLVPLDEHTKEVKT